MINAPKLLTDLKRRLTLLEDDLRERIASLPDLSNSLQAEWQAARDAKRTAETLESWSEQVITQAGVHWLLSCVFLRFIEDNNLVERPWIAGTPESGRLNLARDRHEAYFRAYPLESDRDYLLACFSEAGDLPGLHTFFDRSHNPVFRLGISGDAAMALRQFWQQQDPNTGELLHDFTDDSWNTRFLGDLYQDLSEATRKRYALLQTPEFVEEFILDRTLTPAIREFGYKETRMIDPTCGSGHFLLGGFQRMIDEWSRAEPTRNRRDLAQKALDAVAGVDLNPFAVAISRFRLLVAALFVSDVSRLSEAPDFKIHVAIGDSLLHGKRFGLTATEDMFHDAEHFNGTGLAHAYASEDINNVQRILGRQYHAVVGNPPYIVVKDSALNAAYRSQYASCYRQYSLGVPFTERFFELAVTGHDSQSAGFIGLITTNSFMKREFGSQLIENVLPRLDLTHIVDSSGSWIPGHNKDGTATVILFGRHRKPVGEIVRTLTGKKSEPTTPLDPACGLVWSAIVSNLDRVGSENDFVAVSDTDRVGLSIHPWNITGDAVAMLMDVIQLTAQKRLREIGDVFSGTGRTSADDVLVAPAHVFQRKRVDAIAVSPLVEGDQVRNWIIQNRDSILVPYDETGIMRLPLIPGFARWLWSVRTPLGNRVTFGNSTYFADGRAWWGWHQINVNRLRYKFAITFGEIATHNHFVFDRGGKVFKQTAPVVKLNEESSEDDYLSVLGLLNSSTGCFWMKQVCFPKDGQGQMWTERFAFNSTNIAEFPVVNDRPLLISKHIDTLTRELAASRPAAILIMTDTESIPLPTRSSLDSANASSTQIFQQMVAWQEELDWQCYRLYQLLPSGSNAQDYEHSAPPDVALGERAFEIVLARRVAAGTLETNWFERHGSTPITEIPTRWPADYRQVVQHRISIIEREPNIKLIEQPLFKRRWNSPHWEELEQTALREWLFARLESTRYWTTNANQPPALTSTSRLADLARNDADFMQVAELYAGHADFDINQLVAQLVVSEAVPLLSVQRYTEAGYRKRAQWEDTWVLQRREDEIDKLVDANADTRRQQLLAIVKSTNPEPDEAALNWVETTLADELNKEKVDRKAREVGVIPVPPKYKNTDFLKVDFWRLRGGLDVPKERWISFPGCERGTDGSLVIAWAGWDHLQQATAIAAYFLDMKDNEGWTPERLKPLLVGLLELLPWLEQWHNEIDQTYGERMGDFYKGFVVEEARAMGVTIDELKAWKPEATAAVRRRRATTI